MQEQIQHGIASDCMLCPAALVINARLAWPYYAHVIAGSIEIYNFTKTRGVFRRLKMPTSVKKFIKAFDNGRTVKPFCFTLNIPKIALKGAA